MVNSEFDRRLRRQSKIAKTIARKARESGKEITGRAKVALTRLNGQVHKDVAQATGDVE